MTRAVVHEERDAGIACCGGIPRRRESGSVCGERVGGPSVRLVVAVLASRRLPSRPRRTEEPAGRRTAWTQRRQRAG